MTHYNFIEIGTSDFDTLIQTCDDNSIGLSIDALNCYLDKLPERKNVKKIHAGISDKDGSMDIYFIPPEIIQSHELISWLRGCNSIGNPHPTALKCLKIYGLPETLIQKETVTVKSIPTLFQENNVHSIDYLKIDTEGHDCVIMNSYIDYCLNHPEAFAKKIRFETNKLSLRSDQEIVIERLKKNGYRVVSFEEDAVLERMYNFIQLPLEYCVPYNILLSA
jgi:hypothetical protein